MEIMKRPIASNDVTGVLNSIIYSRQHGNSGCAHIFLASFSNLKIDFVSYLICKSFFIGFCATINFSKRRKTKIINFQLRFLRKIQVLDIIKIFYLIIKQN